jgi:Kelch motif
MASRHGQMVPRTRVFLAMALAVLMAGAATIHAAGSWTTLTNLSPEFPGSTMVLMTDGTVLVTAFNTSTGDWMRLTPDSHGNYANGTWSMVAPMSTPRLYFASNMLQDGRLWVLGGEYSGAGLPSNWSSTGEIYDPVANTWSPITPYPNESGCPLSHSACFGDDPSMLLPGGNILAGDLLRNTPHIYNIATNSWSAAGTKVYNDSSDEEGWAKLPDGTVLTYDLFQSIRTNGSYAETYNPTTNTWTSISPSDGTANGFIPQLSSSAVGEELGPVLRLHDGRVLVLGATGHTALYTQATNTWAAGPDIMGTLNGNPALFGADDAPGAVLPNGHVIFTADAGPSPVTTTGNVTTGSNIITAIPSTALFQVGWAVSGSGIPNGSTISSVDSSSQVHISQNATATHAGDALTFGGIFSNPVQLFDFDPTSNTISALSPAIPDASLTGKPAYVTRMLVLPTGQVLFSDDSRQFYVYTPGGPVDPLVRPVVDSVVYNGSGVFTLTGRQLNGLNAGSAYGDDVESDENYPIVRLINATGTFYARTTNWSSTGVATGASPESVNFTLGAGMTPGNYSLVVSGAGVTGMPMFVTITADQVAGK